MRKGWALRALQFAFIVAVLWFVGRELRAQWGAIASLGAGLRPNWWRVLGSGLMVFVSYGVLIAAWRATVATWGERLPLGAAARIWFISNLGRYVPGKVWQIGAMGVMAQQAGVSAVAAVGSALVVSLVNVLVGFAVVAATGRALLAALVPAPGALGFGIATLALITVSLPWLLPPLMRVAGRLTGEPVHAPHLPARALWVAALGCAIAWLLYGLAFRELSVALLGAASGDAATYVAVFTLSYLVGFIALFAPGGIGVREGAMGLLLVGAHLAGKPEAALLVIASRLWLTVLEIVPGLLLLAWRPSILRPESHDPPVLS